MKEFYINGSIKEIGETLKYGDNFRIRDFILETDEAYPETLKFSFTHDQVDLLDRFIEGEMVTVAFTPKGNEYQGKHYVQLRAMAILEIDEKLTEQKNKKAKVANKRIQLMVEQIKKANAV